MQHRSPLVLLAALLGCASADGDASSSELPPFVGPVPGAAISGSAPASGNAPGGTGTPPAAGGASSSGIGDEGGVTPGAFVTPGTGAEPASAGASGVTGAGGSAGASSSPDPGAAGSATAAAGAGSEPPLDPTTQPDSAQPDSAQPDSAQPDSAQPDPAQPDPAQPDPPAPVPPAPSAGSCPPSALFCDDFEDDALGQFPGAPWQNNTGSGATIQVDSMQAFSGARAVHVNAPPNAAYRRGYFSLETGSSSVFPAVGRSMFGRAMMLLDATPNGVVHWTIIQAEGRAASGTHDAYYRYGGQQQNGAGLMANYETNQGVSTDCYSHSATTMPVQRWACVEWHFDAARNEMQLWLDGTEITDMHVIDRPTTPGSGCLGNAVNGQWLAPPAFQTLHLGWESYQSSSNDRNLWVDDVAIGTERLGCPAP